MKRVALLLVLGLLAAGCSDAPTGSTAATTAPPPTQQTTTSAPVTTAATTTTTVPATTTSTTTTSTTTTVPVPVFGFYTDGFGIVEFGATPEEVAAALDPVLGPPQIDSGWMAEPLCPGPQFRFFQYGAVLFDFRVLFTTGPLFREDSVGHFYSFRYNGETAVPVSPPDLTVGTTVGQLQALHPGVVFEPNPYLSGVTNYVVAGDSEYELLTGRLSGTDPSDTVVSVQGGIGCAE